MNNISSSEEFEQFIAQDNGRTVLVDFHSKGCGPCKMMAPVVEKIGLRYSERLDVIAVDAESLSQIGAQYGLRALPTLMVFKNGLPQGSKVGASSLVQLDAFIGDYL